MIFLFSWVIFRFQPLIFMGVQLNQPTKQTTNTGNQQLIYASCSAGPLGACKPAERPLLVIRHPTKVPVVFLEPWLQQTTNVMKEMVG